MKSILIPIHPEWFIAIVTGLKTVEVRKFQLETPFIVYLYLTKGQKVTRNGEEENGKIVASFCVSHIDTYLNPQDYIIGSCLTEREIREYARGKTIFGWHISNLVIFDHPLQLECFGIKKAPQNFCYIKEKK